MSGGVSVAAGSPWGNVFPRLGTVSAAEGAFNGLWATASVQGVRYTLGPPEDSPAIDEAVERRHRGGYLLMLSREADGQALGLVALRPRQGGGGKHFEITTVLPLDEALDAPQVLSLASGVAAAADSPWGDVFSELGRSPAEQGTFNGLWATASVQGVRYTLGPPEDPPVISEAVERRHQGGYLLVLSREQDEQPLGFVTVRPRLNPAGTRLVQTCRRLGVHPEMLMAGAPEAAQAVARRAKVSLVASADAVESIRQRQQTGAFVAFVSDSAQSGPALAQCDLALGLAPSPTGQFPARADLLAPDLDAVVAVLEAGQRRDQAVRDAVVLSTGANLFGAVWGFRGRPGVERASHSVYVGALASLADGWVRLRGGRRPGSSLSLLFDPRPERWGQPTIATVLHALQTTEAGLSHAQAAQRRHAPPQAAERLEAVKVLLNQLRSPVNSILMGGALLSLDRK